MVVVSKSIVDCSLGKREEICTETCLVIFSGLIDPLLSFFLSPKSAQVSVLVITSSLAEIFCSSLPIVVKGRSEVNDVQITKAISTLNRVLDKCYPMGKGYGRTSVSLDGFCSAAGPSLLIRLFLCRYCGLVQNLAGSNSSDEAQVNMRKKNLP